MKKNAFKTKMNERINAIVDKAYQKAEWEDEYEEYMSGWGDLEERPTGKNICVRNDAYQTEVIGNAIKDSADICQLLVEMLRSDAITLQEKLDLLTFSVRRKLVAPGAKPFTYDMSFPLFYSDNHDFCAAYLDVLEKRFNQLENGASIHTIADFMRGVSSSFFHIPLGQRLKSTLLETLDRFSGDCATLSTWIALHQHLLLEEEVFTHVKHKMMVNRWDIHQSLTLLKAYPALKTINWQEESDFINYLLNILEQYSSTQGELICRELADLTLDNTMLYKQLQKQTTKMMKILDNLSRNMNIKENTLMALYDQYINIDVKNGEVLIQYIIQGAGYPAWILQTLTQKPLILNAFKQHLKEHPDDLPRLKIRFLTIDIHTRLALYNMLALFPEYLRSLNDLLLSGGIKGAQNECVLESLENNQALWQATGEDPALMANIDSVLDLLWLLGTQPKDLIQHIYKQRFSNDSDYKAGIVSAITQGFWTAEHCVNVLENTPWMSEYITSQPNDSQKLTLITTCLNKYRENSIKTTTRMGMMFRSNTVKAHLIQAKSELEKHLSSTITQKLSAQSTVSEAVFFDRRSYQTQLPDFLEALIGEYLRVYREKRPEKCAFLDALSCLLSKKSANECYVDIILQAKASVDCSDKVFGLDSATSVVHKILRYLCALESSDISAIRDDVPKPAAATVMASTGTEPSAPPLKKF